MIIQVVPKEVVLVFITRKSLCKLQYKTKKKYATVLYRSPNQNTSEFDFFIWFEGFAK